MHKTKKPRGFGTSRGYYDTIILKEPPLHSGVRSTRAQSSPPSQDVRLESGRRESLMILGAEQLLLFLRHVSSASLIDSRVDAFRPDNGCGALAHGRVSVFLFPLGKREGSACISFSLMICT